MSKLKQRIETVSEELDLSKKMANKAFFSIFEMIKNELLECREKQGKVVVHGFGSFCWRKVKERNGRNPKTGESIVIPAHDRLVFNPYKWVDPPKEEPKEPESKQEPTKRGRKKK